jgi:ABC-type transport system involved in multi-copper enzyme maturation permease subunit
MIWFTWRRHRAIAITALLATLALLVALLVLGQLMYRSVATLATPACTTYPTCYDTVLMLRTQSNLFHLACLVLLAAPALIGIFVGAPFLAREFEQQTYRLTWTQSVTRQRWLLVQLALLILAVAVAAGLLAAVAAWGEGALLNPAARDTIDLSVERYSAWGYDVSGVVAMAYAVFALALGIALGALFRRTLPAIAATLAGFLAVRLPIAIWLRPHIQEPVLATFGFVSDGTSPTPSPFDWILEQGYLHMGQRFPGAISIPPECAPTTPPVASSGDTIGPCMQAHGWSQYILYQPVDRYPLFQGVEAALFLVLAAALLALTLYWATKRAA